MSSRSYATRCEKLLQERTAKKWSGMNQESKIYNGCFYGNNDESIYAMQKPVQGDFSDLSAK